MKYLHLEKNEMIKHFKKHLLSEHTLYSEREGYFYQTIWWILSDFLCSRICKKDFI